METYIVGSNLGLISFGGGFHVAKCLMLLRQQRYSEAFGAVLPGVEALRNNDPQQLFRLAAAMAFYTAAALGDTERAWTFLKDYEEAGHGGARIARHYADAFAAAGKELFRGDGSGLAELHRLADDLAATQAPAAELQALVLCLSLNDHSRTARLIELTGASEGEWAGALLIYGRALDDGRAVAYVRAAEVLRNVKMTRLAADCFEMAAELSRRDGNRQAAHWAAAGRAAALAEAGIFEPKAARPELGEKLKPLTGREQLIVTLAIQGLTDKQIAEQLHSSVRTVEGHLYRSYAKLGVTKRQDLINVVGMHWPEDHG
jgi:ATP/maltotriose-dependent transcriptional regulator MalT